MQWSNLNAEMESIFNTMNDGLIFVAPDGTIMMVNRAFERMTGYSSGEVLGRKCTLLSCDACEMTLESGKNKTWCALFDPENEGVKRCRCNYIKKDGTYIPVLKNASVLHDEQGSPLGAVETLTDISEVDRLDHELARLSRQLDSTDGYCGIVGSSVPMQQVFDLIQKAALSNAPVIIYGESGTGKELVARAIHYSGQRKSGPYVQFNCAALNESLLESELFGHAKGAFTGAYRHRIGRFEAARGGDIFLDEIGDVPLAIQVKLLRVLDSKQFERVGDHRPIRVDARIITATHKSLEDMIAQGNFRKDLFYRINIIPIHLPPLRDRAEDIPVLVNSFIKKLQQSTGKDIHGLNNESLDLFMSYAWPGNVRELKGALEYAFVIAEQGLVTPGQLPPQIKGAAPEKSKAANMEPAPGRGTLSEKETLIKALRQAKGNQTRAAKLLGVNRVTVYNRMKKYGIQLKRTMTG